MAARFLCWCADSVPNVGDVLAGQRTEFHSDHDRNHLTALDRHRRAGAGRSIPNFLSRFRRVLGCSPNFSAAFASPLMRQSHSSSTRRTCARSTSSIRMDVAGLALGGRSLSSPNPCASCSAVPLVRMTPRSMTFSNSRTLPGQEYLVSCCMTSSGTDSIGLPILVFVRPRKYQTRRGMSLVRSRSGGTCKGKTCRR